MEIYESTLYSAGQYGKENEVIIYLLEHAKTVIQLSTGLCHALTIILPVLISPFTKKAASTKITKNIFSSFTDFSTPTFFIITGPIAISLAAYASEPH